MDVPDALRDLLGLFSAIKDPRVKRTRRHPLGSILALAILAVLSGADNWAEVEQFGKAKRAWLKSFLDLPYGIPSHDTLGRVMAALNPLELEGCFQDFTQGLAIASGGRLIAIDGKTLRHSFEAAGGRAAIHMVHAWCQANGLVLGQLATDAKSNEITAIPRLIRMLDIQGAVVSIDAAGCQKNIARQILGQGGHYILALKDNHKTMFEEVEFFFREALAGGWEDLPHAYARQVEGDHGRVETRRIWCTGQVGWCPEHQDWEGLASFICVECRREVMGGKTSVERRYFVSSLPARDAGDRLAQVRGHWSVENQLHWRLDVSYGEDASRARQGHSAENLSRLRTLTLGLLLRDKLTKVGIKAKRHKAGWDNDYLLSLLSGQAFHPTGDSAATN